MLSPLKHRNAFPASGRFLSVLFAGTLFFAPIEGWGQAGEEAVSATETLRVQLPEILRLSDAGKWKEVLARVKPLQKEYPENPELLLFETAAFNGLDRWRETLEVGRRFLEAFPDSKNRDQALYLVGSALLATDGPRVAVAPLLEASRTTKDPTLRVEIHRMLHPPPVSAPPQKPIPVGIRLGGAPPSGEEEIAKAKRIAERILRMGFDDYKAVHGRYPASLSELVTGDPPILRAIPADPTNPGKPIPLEIPED